MSKSMYMNSENMKALTDRLNGKIQEIEACYEKVNKYLSQIDGSNDNWKGNNQAKFYDYAMLLSKAFPTNVEKFKDFHTFLVNTVNSYEETERDMNKDIDNNESNFTV